MECATVAAGCSLIGFSIHRRTAGAKFVSGFRDGPPVPEVLMLVAQVEWRLWWVGAGAVMFE